MKSLIPPLNLFFALCLSVLFTISASVDAQEENFLEVADYLDFEKVTDAQISPDGRQIVYTRHWIDQSTDRWASALWIMSADGSQHRFLLEGSNARWSPDGDRVLFIGTGNNDKP